MVLLPLILLLLQSPEGCYETPDFGEQEFCGGPIHQSCSFIASPGA